MNEAYMRKALANHTLTKLYDTGEEARPRYVGFRLARGGTGVHAFEVHFTGYGIFVQGDPSPVHVGGFGAKGVTLAWFLGDHESDYLASKFLKRRFVPSAAAADLERHLGESQVPAEQMPALLTAQIPALRFIVRTLREYPDYSPEMLKDNLEDNGLAHLCEDDGVPGWTYDPAEMGWLMAIHECFQRCYQAASEVSNE